MPPWVFDDDFEIGNMLKTPLKYKHDPTRVGAYFKLKPEDLYAVSDLYSKCEKMAMKLKSEMEAPMSITQKMEYVKSDLLVYFNGSYIILKFWKEILLKNPNAKVIKINVGTDTEKVKLQAFCVGLKRLYYEIYKDIFNDKINVVSSFTDGTKTTVMFDDGTDVSCQLHDGDTYIPEAGFAICLCKKIFGSISNVQTMLKYCDCAERRKKNKELLRERRKFDTQNRIKEKKRDYEKQVQDEIMRLRIHQEALKRLVLGECKDI